MYKLPEKKISLLFSFGTYLFILAALYFILSGMLGILLPFVVALAIAILIEKPVDFLQNKMGISRGLSAATTIVLFILLIASGVTFLFYRLLMEIWFLSRDIHGIQRVILYIEQFSELLGGWVGALPEDIAQSIRTGYNELIMGWGDNISAWINGLLQAMLSILKSLPRVMMYTVISLVSAFFISRDREKIGAFVYRQLPLRWVDKARSIKDDLLLAALGYAKVQLILVLVAFVIVLIGYSIIGLQYAFFLALLTAIFDLIPILGPGTIILPAAIINLMAGRNEIALGCIILYIIVLISRQFLEPKILGEHLGLHPLVSLIFIYLGFILFGVVGILLGPLLAITLRSLQRVRILPRWRTADI